MSHFSGFNSWEPISRFDIHRSLHCISLLFLVILTSYSIYSEWPNKLEVLKVSLGVGILIQTVVKATVVITKCNTIAKIRIEIEKMYEQMEKVDDKRKAILKDCIRQTIVLIKVILAIDAVAYLLYLFYPIVNLMFMEERSMMFPFYSPFIEQKSIKGYLFNSFLHEFIVFYSMVFHVPFDISFGLVAIQVAAKRQLLSSDFDDVEEFVLQFKLKSPIEQKKMTKMLRNLIISHKELDSFIEEIGNFYLIPCFATIITGIFSICVGLILVLVLKWELGYSYSWSVLGQILICCAYGRIVYDQTEILSDRIWSFPWYLLCGSERKLYQLLMLKAQRPINMEIQVIGPVNMETFKNVRLYYAN